MERLKVLTTVLFCSDRRPGGPLLVAPELGDADGKRLYRLPLSYAQMTELFGKPERLSYWIDSSEMI